ncbi:MAG: hypothetical protein CL613_09315 [Aquimarina sp.]|nr:hypothetical protein [Aquimarina sp.]
MESSFFVTLLWIVSRVELLVLFTLDCDLINIRHPTINEQIRISVNRNWLYLKDRVIKKSSTVNAKKGKIFVFKISITGVFKLKI